MPVKSSRTKRYNSEYKSHYKKFSSKRPDTVKGEITRSIIPYGQESHVSTPRAGLQSTQLGVIHEPPLQRKKIVPYEKNHNIFQTGTVKELTEKQWLNANETAREYSHKTHKCSPEPKSYPRERHESPMLVAEKKLLKSAPAKVVGYNYISDGVKRRSTYTQDFAEKGRKSRSKREKSPVRKPKPALGGTKSGISPDRLPAAGVRTMTSIGDKRLIQPSDNSQYMKSPYKDNVRVYDSEYSSRFKFINGAWIESPEFQGRPNPVYASKPKMDWYEQVINRRNEAYGYAKHARGTHFSREELDYQNRLNAKYNDDEDDKSVSAISDRSSKSSKKKRNITKKDAPKEDYPNDRPPIRREAWSKRPASPVESSHSISTLYTETTEAENGQFLLERGRSPTPELRETGHSRRHHYDMTTNILNEKLEKSLTFSPSHKQEVTKRNGHSKTSLSTSIKSQDGSYVPAIRHKRQDDDVMSERSMTSRASSATETLERARNRQDFWSKQNKKLDFED